MFRRIRIRTKLGLALALPLLSLVAIAGFEVNEASAKADDVRAQTDLAAGALGPGSLVTGLQDERNRAAIDLIGLGSATELAVETNEEARAIVDDAEQHLRRQLAGRGITVQRAFAPAFDALEDLRSLRADIDAYDGPMDISNTDFADEVFSRYTTIVEAFFDSTSRTALAVDDAELRSGVVLVDAASRQTDLRARLVRDIVVLTLTGEEQSVAGQQSVAALYDRARGYDATIRANAIGRYEGVADETFEEQRVIRFNRLVEEFLASGEVDVIALLDSVKTTQETGYTGLRNRASDVLGGVGNELLRDVEERERAFMAAALLGVALTVVVTWIASRSITEPLQALTDQAEEMASERLPTAVQQILDTPAGEDVTIPDIDPIEVQTRDEVWDVASALNAVQRSALDLAVEQAVLRRNIADSFVNLGRRNQNLLNRQLDFITDLEQEETDPDSLEGLFRLDHLATRMRRNAESLLVLAGIDPPRQWSAPVNTADVVRAALGEVEDYQRVVVRHLEPASIAGAVAADVAHVLAELVENALSFSPPEEAVEVKGRLTTKGYTLAITDNGMGMTPADLARANRRLSGGESFTVAPSRYLGHYVAGHLAQRIGLEVELYDNPAGGITARVDIPMALVADEELDPLAAAATADGDASPVVPSREGPAAGDASPSSSLPATAPAPLPDPVTEHGLPRRSGEPAGPGYDGDAGSFPAAPAHQPVAQPAASPFEAPVAPPTAPAPQPVAETAPPPPPPTPPAPAAPGGGLFGDAFADAKPVWAQPAAPAAPAPPPPGLGESPAAGAAPAALPRRVPGAQRPDGELAPMAAAEPDDRPADGGMRSSPDDVYAFLSSFQSGVTRGRADANGSEEGGR